MVHREQSNHKRFPNVFLSPVVLIRLSSVLFVGLMLGHASAYPWTSTRIFQDTQLVDSMKSVAFEFMGERSTYWNLYFGWGLLISVLLLTFAFVLWRLSGIAHLVPQTVGIISGFVSATSLVGAYLSFRFFYIPPFLVFSAIFVVLLTAAGQLLRQQRMVVDGEMEKL